mmetsp:Transcript_15616/g.36559  ORF Transcript_15616/g.36559 Transcript_15616/m.36559 type:complete len:438 (+) Transcript_15616:72-1385(+)
MASASRGAEPPLSGRTDMSVDSIDSTDEVPEATAKRGTPAQTPAETKKAESKLSKMKTRLLFGTPMIFLFFALVYLGHPYMVLLVVLIQVGLFRELVNVKYKPAKEKHVPLFRTIQWSMFWLAMAHVYGEVFIRLGLTQSVARYLPAQLQTGAQEFIKYQGLMVFTGYCMTFVVFVLTLKQGLYKYQIGNVVWTVGVLALIVWQITGATVLIFAGLFWFMLPCGLVVANDCFAYFCGVALGRRFIKQPFLALSPNKTWEGFIGAYFCTLAWGWYFSGWISEWEWLVCPQPKVEPFGSLRCAPADVFTVQDVVLPTSAYPLLAVRCKPCQLHSLVLASFASFVAPFGGFLASAIKRAYGLKDFDSLIPGHGGFMDRMDCQLLMLLCTFVHYRTFVQDYGAMEETIMNMILALPPEGRGRILAKLRSILDIADTCANPQ